MDNGTRLGHFGPKGTFKIQLKNKKKYLFEIIIDTLKKQNRKYNIIIPWYVMTSKENNNDTIKFLKENNYFGYPKEKVKIFIQGELPILNKEGKMLLDKNGLIIKASDGNGSIYTSMKNEGILKDMREKNIEWVYISSIDNILLKLVEPTLLGLTIQQNNLIGSKTIIKNSPEEKVGVFCKKDGVPTVIEYTELSEEMSKQRDLNNELVFGEAHIMCNLFNIKAIEKIANEKLPYHIAVKKIPYYKNGKEVKIEEPNAYKYESFIFDGFSKFENITLLRGKREEDFAPIKNREGADSPKTAAELYNRINR